MAPKQEYPKWMYGPADKDGKPQSRIFNKDDQVPKGWEDHPDKVKETAREPSRQPAKQAARQSVKESTKPAEGEPTPEEKAATIAELRAAGAEISDDASVEEINAAIDKLTK